MTRSDSDVFGLCMVVACLFMILGYGIGYSDRDCGFDEDMALSRFEGYLFMDDDVLPNQVKRFVQENMTLRTFQSMYVTAGNPMKAVALHELKTICYGGIND